MRRPMAVLLLCVAFTSAAAGANWPSWRGPDSNGVAPGTGFPTEWSATKNVLWKVDLPGKGASTPVVWGDRIVLTCGMEGQNGVICFDWKGNSVWERKIGREVPGKNAKASGCNSSAVTDGERLYVYFKSGDLACLDFSGKILWELNVQKLYGKDTLWWDLGTSPVLTRDFVVIAVMQTGPSYLAAFDRNSGKVAWKQDRNLDAPVEAAQSYTTP